MAKYKYLVSFDYPFGFKEQFLETEIKYWQGKDITLLPIIKSSNIRDYGDLKLNTSIANTFGKLRSIHFGALLNLFFSLDFYKEIFNKPSVLFSKTKLISLLRYMYLGIRFEKSLTANLNFNSKDTYVFYSYWFSWPAYGLARVKKKYKNISIITRAHRVDLYSYSQPYNYMPLNKRYAKQIDCIYSISADGKDHLSEEYGIPTNKLEVARLGVNPQHNTVERSVGNTVHFLSVSYVKKVKRVDLIYKSIENYAMNNPTKKVHWTHIGAGELFQSLQEITQSSQIQVNLLGMIDNSGVYDFYKNNAVDVFVNLSESEGIPVSIMEAISFGVPIIATDVGGTGEIVKASVGQLLPLNLSSDDFNNAVNKVIKIDSSSVLSFFNDNYNAAKNYPEFIDKINKL